MSRTNRSHNYRKDGWKKKGVQKTKGQDGKGLHKSCMGHKSVGKYALGPAGINCPCCTKLPADEMKVAIRRLDRRKVNQNNLKNLVD
jgi:hypothetical protein